MPFYFTLDFLTGKYALVFIKKSGGTPPTPHYTIPVFAGFIFVPQ